MAAPVILRNVQDSYVDQTKPNKNYNSLGRMYLQDGAFGYLFFANPIPPGAQVISAKLRVWNGDAITGTNTMSLYRVAAKWSASKITWNNRPGVTGAVKTIVRSGSAAGALWEFDVTDMMQTVSSGAAWYGFRIDLNGAARKWIHSSASSTTGKRPQLEIEWSDAPSAPSDLSPDDLGVVSVAKPTLKFDFTDVSGDKTMSAYRIQIDPAANWAAPAYDTGTVLSDSSIANLATQTVTYPGLSAGATTYWRVQVRDAAGLWSDWSGTASFRRVNKGTFTVTNPSAGTPIVEDATPPIIWTLTGVTQASYLVKIIDPETAEELWSSGPVTSSVNTVTIPEGVIKTLGKTYQLQVRVTDTEDRVATVDDPNFYTIEPRDFTYAASAGVAAVSSVSVSATTTGGPGFNVTAVTASAPDSFTLIRDGEVVRSDIRPADVLVGGTTDTYRIPDLKVPGRQEHTWEVRRVVNSKESSVNPSVTATLKNVLPWLTERDGSNAVALLNPVVDPGLSEESDVLYPMGAPPVLITQSQWGFVGSASGVFSDSYAPAAGVTARDQLTRFKRMRRKVGQTFYFSWDDHAIECYIYECRYRTLSNPDGSNDYEVSFSFVQVDY
jgi:hypothetical protein